MGIPELGSTGIAWIGARVNFPDKWSLIPHILTSLMFFQFCAGPRLSFVGSAGSTPYRMENHPLRSLMKEELGNRTLLPPPGLRILHSDPWFCSPPARSNATVAMRELVAQLGR